MSGEPTMINDAAGEEDEATGLEVAVALSSDKAATVRRAIAGCEFYEDDPNGAGQDYLSPDVSILAASERGH